MLEIPNTNNITVIQLTGQYEKISISIIYNNCNHSRNERTLKNFICRQSNSILGNENNYMIWASDFNRHHPLWDSNEDIHLFTQQAT